MSSHVMLGVSTTVSLRAEGDDLPIAKRKFSMVTAREFRTSASMFSSSKSMSSIFSLKFVFIDKSGFHTSLYPDLKSFACIPDLLEGGFRAEGGQISTHVSVAFIGDFLEIDVFGQLHVLRVDSENLQTTDCVRNADVDFP